MWQKIFLSTILYPTTFILFSMNTIGVVFAAEFDSHYSSIAEKDCKTESSDNHSSTQRCAHFAGLSIIVTDTNARQDIILQQEEGGKRFPLNFPQTVSPAFSALGDKIEWRHQRGKKTELAGMIVRLNVSENPDKPNKTTSYLVVSKVTDKQICVVGKVPPQTGDTQNEQARTMAEKSSTMPCIDVSAVKAGKTTSVPAPSTPVDADSAMAISRATYECDGKIAFEVAFDIGKVRYTMLNETIVLKEEATATTSVSGSRYSDGETILWLNGNEAMVEINGVSPFSACKTLSRKKQ